MSEPILVNRAPVLTLWAAVVAERMGFDPAEALSLPWTPASLPAVRRHARDAPTIGSIDIRRLIH